MTLIRLVLCLLLASLTLSLELKTHDSETISCHDGYCWDDSRNCWTGKNSHVYMWCNDNENCAEATACVSYQ